MTLVRMIGMAALAVSAARVATAQDTTCQTVGNQTYCNTSPAPARPQFVNPPSQVLPPPPAYGGRGLVGEFMDAMLRKKVGSLIASGQCDEAKNTALRAGNFEMAQQAVLLCQPPQNQSAPKASTNE